MFHVLLALPAIAVFGTVAGTVLAVLADCWDWLLSSNCCSASYSGR